MISYHVGKDGKQIGSFDEKDIREQVSGGILSTSDLCWREGMAEWMPIGAVLGIQSNALVPPPIAIDSTRSNDLGTPLFLYVSVARLVVLSILTLGLYEAYWIYKNWRYVKERDGLNISPFWRGVFGIFHIHSLLRRVHSDVEARRFDNPTFSPGGLATGFVVLTILANLVSRAPGVAGTLVSAFVPSFLFLIPVQNYINSVTLKRNPNQRKYGWSSGHIVCIVFGCIVWAALLMGGMEEM